MDLGFLIIVLVVVNVFLTVTVLEPPVGHTFGTQDRVCLSFVHAALFVNYLCLFILAFSTFNLYRIVKLGQWVMQL